MQIGIEPKVRRPNLAPALLSIRAGKIADMNLRRASVRCGAGHDWSWMQCEFCANLVSTRLELGQHGLSYVIYCCFYEHHLICACLYLLKFFLYLPIKKFLGFFWLPSHNWWDKWYFSINVTLNLYLNKVNSNFFNFD